MGRPARLLIQRNHLTGNASRTDFRYYIWGGFGKRNLAQIPLEFIDDTLGFNAEWVVDRIAPRPVLFITTDNDRLVPPEESESLYRRAGEPKKLVVLRGFGHYEVYTGEPFRQVMAETGSGSTCSNRLLKTGCSASKLSDNAIDAYGFPASWPVATRGRS